MNSIIKTIINKCNIKLIIYICEIKLSIFYVLISANEIPKTVL